MNTFTQLTRLIASRKRNPLIKYLQKVKFKKLPKTAKLALIHYMAKDGEAWPLWKGIDRYDKEVGNLPFLFGMVPYEDFKRMYSKASSNPVSSFAKYSGYSTTNPWPVILDDPYYEEWEFLQDGWHRGSTYLAVGLKKIPALGYLPNVNYHLGKY